jgi:hypothetical protein
VYPFTGYKTSNRFERAKVRVASSRLNRLDVAPKKFAPSANTVAPVAPMNTRRGDTGAMFDDDDDDGNDGAARRSVSELSSASSCAPASSSFIAFSRRPPRFSAFPTPSRGECRRRRCRSVPRWIDDRHTGVVIVIGVVIK